MFGDNPKTEQGWKTPKGVDPKMIPPHDLDAEKSVLGGVLVRNEAIHDVIDVGLQPDDFYKEAHRKIFQLFIDLNERGEPLDLVTLTSALRDRKWYEAIGGNDTLTNLFENSFSAGNVSHYAKLIRKKALVRRMIEASAEIMAKGYDGIENVEAYVDEAEQKIFGVSQTKSSQGFSNIQEILMGNVQSIEELSQNKTAISGLPTGFTLFDQKTSGLHAGQLMIVAGRPGMGKSSLVNSIAQNVAVTDQRVVALFSLEMAEDELGLRLLSAMSRIDSRKLKTGRLLDRDWPRLAQAAEKLSKAKIFIDDSGDLTAMDMRARCRRLLAKQGRVDLIVVDYLQLMSGSRGGNSANSSREREISEISRGLKALAKELSCPIIALSQLNRGVESRPDKRPMLMDLRESGAIEQDADIVCFVYRDEVYHPETEDKGVAELIVAKHRAGDTGTIRLAWLAEYTLFGNLDDAGAPITSGRRDRGDITL